MLPDYHDRCCARISLGAIEKNFLTLRSYLAPSVKALAVVKADAYGHGAVPVARRLEPLADYFGVATVEEGITLRENGIQKPILILSYTAPARFAALVEKHLTATLYTMEEARALSRIAVEKGLRAKVHLAVDTGMSRIGVTPDERGVAVARSIASLEGIDLEGVFSHHACADCADLSVAEEQNARFDAFLSSLKAAGLSIRLPHMMNSAGSVLFSEKYAMCRFGISLYGYPPSREMAHLPTLFPAMEVVSHVIHLATHPAGTPVGYGHTYVTPTERRLATVAIGYADGFCRNLSGRGFVLIRGKRAPVVGRVCMDQIMVDVTEHPLVELGDEAVVLGQSGDESLWAEELGEMSHSFHYEVLCNFMPRVTRRYLD